MDSYPSLPTIYTVYDYHLYGPENEQAHHCCYCHCYSYCYSYHFCHYCSMGWRTEYLMTRKEESLNQPSKQLQACYFNFFCGRCSANNGGYTWSMMTNIREDFGLQSSMHITFKWFHLPFSNLAPLHYLLYHHQLARTFWLKKWRVMGISI